jgi:serine/threonine protein kinase
MTALAVDTRSDIYSLGALLYELLVGALPFEPDMLRQAGHAGIPRIIRESDPPPLYKRLEQLGDRAADVANRRRTTVHALRRGLQAEPDWIVAKAMDKDPGRRYASASELAADIQRFLRREPVAAAPPSPLYRVRTFVRRRLPAVITAAIAAIASRRCCAPTPSWSTS